MGDEPAQKITIKDILNKKIVRTIRPEKTWSFLGHLILSPDGKLLVAVSNHRSEAWVVNTSDGEVIAKLDFVFDEKVAFSPDGKKLVFSGHYKRDEGLGDWVWTIGTKQRINLKAPGNTFGFAFSPDSRLVAVHSGDRSVGTLASVYSLDTGKLVFKVRDDGIGSGGSLSFAPDGRRLAAAGEEDREVKIWDIYSGKKVIGIEHIDGVLDVAFHPSGRVIAALCKDRSLYYWDLEGRSDQPISRLRLADDPWRVRFSPDGKALAVTSGGSQVAGSTSRIGPFTWAIREVKNLPTPTLKKPGKPTQ